MIRIILDFRSLDIKVKAMGWMNNDVGLTLMNMGTVEMHRKNYPKALEYAQQCWEIYKVSRVFHVCV